MNNKKIFHISLCLIGLFCTWVTFWYFNTFPERQSFAIYFFGIPTITTILIPFVCILLLIEPTIRTINIAKIHAAFCLSFYLFATLTKGSPGHSSPLGDLGGLIEITLYGILLFELALIQVAITRKNRKGIIEQELPFAFTLTTLALFGGCSLGIIIWSTLLPSKVIAEAELAANGKPYCFSAKSRRDLTGINMYSRDDNGFTWSFHKLMTVGEGTEKIYMNWSYRQGKFDLIADYTRKAMHLEDIQDCTPKPHFALDLPLF